MRNEEVGSTNGTAHIDPAREVIAGRPGTWTITYTAGPDGVAVGGSVRFEIPYGFTNPQTKWFHDPGYVSAACSRRDVRLSLSLDPPVTRDPEPFYYVTRWGRMVYVQVLDRPLAEGDTIALEYGHLRHSNQAGAVAPYFAQRAEFTVATDVTGTRDAGFSGYTLLARQPYLEVLGGEPDHLEVVIPSLVEVGEEFPLRIVCCDEFGNYAEGVDVDPDLYYGVEEDNARQLEDTTLGQALTTYFSLPGQRTIAAEDPDVGVMGMSNPCYCVTEPATQRVFWGDIHGHTGLSDGLGSPYAYYDFGRDEACLDFCAITDHAQYLSDEDWEVIQRATAEANEPGRFVTLLGYEYSCNGPVAHYGDKCLYYPGDRGPLLRETDINRSGYVDTAEFAAQWKAHGAMMVLHQHARGTCTFYDPDLVRLVEVYSVWGGSESDSTTRTLLPALDHDYSGHYAADALAQGWVLGFTGSSDDHAGRPGRSDWLRVQQAYPGGLVAVWAPELTREAIWDALWNRRCYATSGKRIYLEFWVDGEPMGSVIEGSAFTGTHVIEARVLGTQPLVAVEILRGREPIEVQSSYSPSLQLAFRDTPPSGSANYYYLRVTQADGEMAWSSPVWVI